MDRSLQAASVYVCSQQAGEEERAVKGESERVKVKER